MHTQHLIHHDGSTELEAFVARPEDAAKPTPAVLICHAWSGQSEFEREKARLLAEWGWVGFAVDVYGKGRRGTDTKSNSALMSPFLADRALLERRLRAALDACRELEGVDAERVAVIGFCFGGLCALDLARSGAGVVAAVSFHGLLNGRDGLETVKSPVKVLALHGHDDPMATADQVAAFTAEMTAAGTDWQPHQYGHTMHAFTNPSANDPGFGTVYEPKAARRSFASMRALLDEAFA